MGMLRLRPQEFLEELEGYMADIEYMFMDPKEYFEDANPVVFENVISTKDFLITKEWFLAKIDGVFIPIERSSKKDLEFLKKIIKRLQRGGVNAVA